MIEKLRICDWSMGCYSVDTLALRVRRIANSTWSLRDPTAATRRPSGRRPVQVSGVSRRPGKTHESWDVSSKRRSMFGCKPGGPRLTRPLLVTGLPGDCGRSGPSELGAD